MLATARCDRQETLYYMSTVRLVNYTCSGCSYTGHTSNCVLWIHMRYNLYCHIPVMTDRFELVAGSDRGCSPGSHKQDKIEFKAPRPSSLDACRRHCFVEHPMCAYFTYETQSKEDDGPMCVLYTKCDFLGRGFEGRVYRKKTRPTASQCSTPIKRGTAVDQSMVNHT
jgi:hypothetical protein